MLNKWKKEKSEILLRHSRLTVIEDYVVLPDGKHTSYLRFKYKNNAVLIIPIRNDGKILMQKEYSYPQNKNLLQFPGGFLLDGENTKQGINRELSEESQLYANKLSLLGYFFLDNRRSKTKVFVYLGRGLTKPKENLFNDDEENISNYWYTEDEIDNLISTGKIVIFPVLSAWCLYKNCINKKK